MEEQKKAEEAAEAAIQAAEAEDREEMAAKGRRKSKS